MLTLNAIALWRHHHHSLKKLKNLLMNFDDGENPCKLEMNKCERYLKTTL